MKKVKRLISIVIPAYNEEEGLDELYRRLQKVLDGLDKYSFEVIIVENGSRDDTYKKLLEIHQKDKRFKIVQLSKNFNCDGGISAGLKYVRGDAVILMNADLQDPPEIIPEFINKWEQGYEIIYGVIQKRKGVSILRKMVSWMFYQTIYSLTNGQIKKNVSDFRLIDKKVYEVINSMPEHNRFLRGMISWTGFKSTGIPFVRAERYKEGGEAKVLSIFQRAKNIKWFVTNAIFTFSDFPLKLMTSVGAFTSFLSFILAMYFLGGYLIYGTASPGYVKGHTSLMLVILFLFGVLFIFLGIIGKYISKIYDEVKQRPLYIVRDKIGV
ncbi:MAG: glycosyltransferase family 2 protein [Candidatus Nanoarchaeia archaeon]|nr:glycosyltransferase family 2 protein [Candidatus Nanoarchaeia archaeon]MDD5358112.1 glycosyltransferase family 2 protein [Candidatus Nanoarchaeia archaeon]MDD5589299.1 glycosyltransferase family 2 protein [Candidatus Nanoarchaeia archaeon]